MRGTRGQRAGAAAGVLVSVVAVIEAHLLDAGVHLMQERDWLRHEGTAQDQSRRRDEFGAAAHVALQEVVAAARHL